MEKIALFPGSFDPMTVGHLALLKRAESLFDKIIVAIGVNTEKKALFPLDQRIERIRIATSEMPNIEVCTYDTLTTDFCREKGAKFILRGVRSIADFEYEKNIADINKLLCPEIETVILLADIQYATISSSMVREMIAFGKDVSQYTV